MQLAEAIDLIDNKYLRRLRLPDPLGDEPPKPMRWADLGCGSGLFTLALSHFLPVDSVVYAIDRRTSVRQQKTADGVSIVPFELDFVKDALNLGELDGIIMANSLHYVEDKPGLIQKLEQELRPGLPFVLVEYDTDVSLPVWVPYPVSFNSLQNLFYASGYVRVEKISDRPSAFGRSRMYSALVRP